MDPKIEKLKARLSELIAWNEEITAALQKNPDVEERRRLAAELQHIQQEMKNIKAEREAISRQSASSDDIAGSAITGDALSPEESNENGGT